MPHLTSIQRKVVYVLILLVLGCLNFEIGRPPRSVSDSTGVTREVPGGQLSRMRADMKIADAQIGQIDPSSTTMKLATFGMRGVAISILWYHANEYEKRDDWNNVIATGDQLVLLEPHFTKVWEFLGWKIAYNASATFDDYRERYRWVIRGFDFLTRGLEYNHRAAKLYKNAGWTISQKIGIADENEQYRRLLREDESFGKRYDCTLPSERDNWMLGRRWYHIGENLVLDGESIGKESDFLYFANSRLNLFNYAVWVRKDGKFGKEAKDAWAEAGRDWKAFGFMELSTAIESKEDKTKMNRTYLERADEITKIENGLIEELHSIAPGLFKELCLKRWALLGETRRQQVALLDRLTAEPEKTPQEGSIEKELTVIREHLDATEPDWREKFKEEHDLLYTPEQRELKAVPGLLLDEMQQGIVAKGNEEVRQIIARSTEILAVSPKVLEEEIQEIDALADDRKARARRIMQEIESYAVDKRMSILYQGILNYHYRNKEYVIEQTDEADDARRLRHIGRIAYYDNRRAESAKLWLESMDKWNELFHKPGFEYVEDEPIFARDLLEMLEKFVIILDADNDIFPPTFGLQNLLRKEMMNQTPARSAIEAQDWYDDKRLESRGDTKVKQDFQAILEAWTGVNQSREYMKLAPLPDIRDKMLAALATYVTVLERLKEPVPEELPLQSYAELMLRYDSLPVEGTKTAQKAETLFQENKYDEAEAEVLKAIDVWKQVLRKYPFIKHRSQLGIHAEMLASVRLYEQSLRAQEKPLPEEPVLPMQ
ncbi:MAG TPA: hypothetical protein DEB39_04890 [Planctomycetaceae bacterium]|nr:hypothetical protein [Planctomycetaceae bacterium]